MALFEGYERRIDQINAVLNSYGISSIEEAEKITKDAGLDVYDQVKKIQPICFENACWAYTVGAAIAIKKGCTRAADAAAAIGEGLQAFCIPGSVADHRKVGLGHGNLGKMLLEEETECFCFLAGHESFAAAEGAIGIAEKANKVRQKPLRVILNGLGKDAAQIISRINGFTFVETQYDYKAAKLNVVYEKTIENDIDFSVDCKDNLSFVAGDDLAVLIGNLADNAVEALAKEQNKKLKISIFQNGSYGVLNVQNYCSSSVLQTNPTLYTSKEDKKNHGKGISIVKSIAKKYGGDVVVSEKNNEFIVSVILDNRIFT